MNNQSGFSRSFLSGVFLWFIFGTLLSCNQPAKKNIAAVNAEEHKDTIRRKPPSGFSDTLTIHFPSAVFFNPDSLQLQKIKEIISTSKFESLEHDCFYQMQNARIVLKKYWSQIHIIETTENRYLLFVKANKSKICIDLNSRDDICGIFLFDGMKEPELVDMTNIDTALGFYFSK